MHFGLVAALLYLLSCFFLALCLLLDIVLTANLGDDRARAFWIGLRRSLGLSLLGRLFRWVGARIIWVFSRLSSSIGWTLRKVCRFLFGRIVDHLIEVGSRPQKASAVPQNNYSNFQNPTAGVYVMVPRWTIIRVRDFSVAPGGLTDKDGPHNAEQFRKTVLVPALLAYDHVEVQLDGVYGYAYNWLVHSFGRFPDHGIDRLTAAKKLKVTYAEKSLSVFKTIAERAIKEGIDA